MKQVRHTLGRWVQRVATKSRTTAPALPISRPIELDVGQLTQVSGGNGAAPATPVKGW